MRINSAPTGPTTSATEVSGTCTRLDAQVAVLLARAYLRLLSQRHISPRVGHLAPVEDSSDSVQIQLDVSASDSAVQTLTEAVNPRLGEEN